MVAAVVDAVDAVDAVDIVGVVVGGVTAVLGVTGGIGDPAGHTTPLYITRTVTPLSKIALPICIIHILLIK